MNRFTTLIRQFLQKASFELPVVCLDLGSGRTRMTVDGKLVYFDTTSFFSKKNSDYSIALGNVHKQASISENLDLKLVRPINSSKVTDSQDLARFLQILSKKFLRKHNSLLLQASVYCSLPSFCSSVQKEAFKESLHLAGFASINFVQNAQAIYNYLRSRHKNLDDFFVLDVGEQVSSLGYLSSQDDLFQKSIEWGVELFIKKVAEYVRREYKVLLCKESAQKIVQELAQFPSKKYKEQSSLELTLQAKDLLSNLPTTITIRSSDFANLYETLAEELLDALEFIFDELKPEALESISQHGLFLLGGGSYLKAIDDYLSEKLAIPVNRVAHADTALIRGLELVKKTHEYS